MKWCFGTCVIFPACAPIEGLYLEMTCGQGIHGGRFGDNSGLLTKKGEAVLRLPAFDLMIVKII
jgi:hypothetical protein